MSDFRERLRREALWRRACRDPHWVARNFWYIKHPKGSRLLDLRDAQDEALTRWAIKRENSITLKARQIGWSTLVAYLAFWDAFFHPEQEILFLSRGEREAQQLLAKVAYGLHRLPPWLRERGPDIVTDNLQKLSFSNDSSILSLPSASNPARGFTGTLVVVDEWAFLPNAEEAWAAIEPVADVGGQIICLSTANGSGNFFHEMWQRAEDGNSVFKPMFFGWDAVPERDIEWYETKKREMLPWQLHQEYPSNPREAFIKSGMMVFSPDVLDRQAANVEPPSVRGMLHAPNPERPDLFQWRENPDGFISVWEMPTPDGVYVVGADVAEGLAHGDYSSATVLDARTGRQVAEWHGHIEAFLFGEELYRLGMFYNGALMVVEINNHGLTTVTQLRQLRYPRIWRRRDLNKTTSRTSVEYGWKTSRVTKPLLIDTLAQALTDGITVRSDGLLRELTTYTRDDKGAMSGSPFDDRVISAALAAHGLAFAFAPEYEPTRDITGTLEWWESMIPDRQPADEWVITPR